MKRILFVVLGFLLLGSLLAATRSTWGMLFHTGFETPDYTAGLPLVGQDGWVGVVSVDAAEVAAEHGTARSGRRAVQCWAGDLEVLPYPMDWLFDGAWEQLIEFDALTNPAEVRVQADVRLIGPDTGEGPGWDLLSANLMARNAEQLAAHRAPFFMLSSNGNAYANAYSEEFGYLGYMFETPIKFGDWNRLAMILNYRTHLCTFEVNNKTIGSLPFGGSGEQFTSVFLEMAAWNDESFDVTPYMAYWDNISVQAKPAKKEKK